MAAFGIFVYLEAIIQLGSSCSIWCRLLGIYDILLLYGAINFKNSIKVNFGGLFGNGWGVLYINVLYFSLYHVSVFLGCVSINANLYLFAMNS